MLASEDLNSLLKDTMKQMNLGHNGKKEEKGTGNENNNEENSGSRPSPSGLLVVAGILGGVLEVNSILVDVEQTVQIVVVGSLKDRSLQSASPSIEDFMESFLSSKQR